MFFTKIPSIEYDKKPISFPISEKEYVLAKNFFRNVRMNDTSFSYSTYFNKYTITDDDRLDILAQKFFGSVNYDWVIIITNNIINPLFDLPVKDIDLYSLVESKYNSVDAIHHYETIEIKNSLGEILQKSGIKVDATFSNEIHKFYERSNSTYFTKTGLDASIPVSNYEYEKTINDNKREIYVLRKGFLDRFVSQFDDLISYSKSNAYIDSTTKKSGI
jgi:hypothetical protein